MLTSRGIRHPDLVVTRRAVRASAQFVTDAELLIEVLGESSTVVDRGVKRVEYTALPSPSRYVMLAPDAAIALICARDEGFEERQEREVLALPEFGLTLPLAELYVGLLD